MSSTIVPPRVVAISDVAGAAASVIGSLLEAVVRGLLAPMLLDDMIARTLTASQARSHS